MRTILTLIIVLGAHFTCVSKPRVVHLHSELKKATRIIEVEIIKIKNQKLFFRNLSNNLRQSVKTQGHVKNPADKLFTGNYPNEGEFILLVIDSNNTVSLYAKELDDYYRFWSPQVTGSVAMFYYDRPALPLTREQEEKQEADGHISYMCWDGCLLPKDELTFRNH